MTVVLLHPVGLDAQSWQFISQPDAEAHEYPGHGSRQLNGLDGFSMADLAAEVVEQHDGQLDLVGLSLGGMVAQHVATRYPERVRSLFIACTSAASDPATMLERAASVLDSGMAPLVESTLQRWFTPSTVALPNHPGVAYARDRLRSDDPRAFSACWRAMSAHDVRADLPSVAQRTTCVAGSEDPASPVPVVRAMFELLPNARFEVLDGPHMLQLECPAALDAALQRHFAWVAEIG